MLIRRTAVTALTALLLSSGLLAPADPSSAAPGAGSSAPRVAADRPAGSYVTVPSQRLLDTRTGTGGPTGPVPAHATITVTVTGTDGVPSTGVAAVVANLTVVAPTANGYITAYPDGTARPTSSNTNFATGDTRAHAAVLIPGADGAVTFYNGSSGPTDLLLDVSGYYTAGSPTANGAFDALAPTRLLDTRIGLDAAKAAVGPGAELDVPVNGHAGVPSADVSAVLVDVIVTAPAAGGHISVPVQDVSDPDTAVSFRAGQTVSGLQVVTPDQHGQLRLTNNSDGTVELVADVFGYYRGGTPAAAGLLGPVPPATLLDTRVGTGQAQPSAVAAHGTVPITIGGSDLIPTGATAAAVTVTVTGATANGYVNVYASGMAPPATSSVNFAAGRTTTNFVIAAVGADGRVVLSNNSARAIDLVVSVDAYVGVLPGPLTWSAPHAVGIRPTLLTCTSSTFCAAAENTFGNQVTRFNGTTWLPPQTVPGAANLTQLSCASANFCLAIGTGSAGVGVGDVAAFVYRNGAWAKAPSPPVTNEPSDAPINSLSCVSATFCMDVEEPDDNAYIFDGAHWSTSHNPLPTATVDANPVLSCASSTFCVVLAFDYQFDGYEWGARFDGSTWTPTAAFSADSGDVTGLSCPTATFCGATTNSAGSTFNGSTWTEVDLASPPYGQGVDAESVSCPSAALCVAVGLVGQLHLYQNGVWSSPLDIDGVGEPLVVSCPTITFCAVGDVLLDAVAFGTPSGQ